jgi:hypothetical protein
MRATSVALLQGSSLRSRLCCPGPSSLNRPHPSHSQAHHNFIARRFICDAFAVRERLGDPRAVPGFHCAFHPDMPSPETPGSSTSNSSRQRCRHRPSPSSDRLGTPKIPAIRFAQGVHFVAGSVRHPQHDSDSLSRLFPANAICGPAAAPYRPCLSRLAGQARRRRGSFRGCLTGAGPDIFARPYVRSSELRIDVQIVAQLRQHILSQTFRGERPRISRAIWTTPREAERTRRACGTRTR